MLKITNVMIYFFLWQTYEINDHILNINGAVMPPPWADPKLNPCALKPRGWQLLYWPLDGKCYKIFQIGYPCPNDMELTPYTPKGRQNQQLSAQCRCPPKHIQNEENNKCYKIYTKGPCDDGYYFAPNNTNTDVSKKLGKCTEIPQCPTNELFWPADGRCYQKYTKGPCSKGQLLVETGDSNMVECQCNQANELLKKFYNEHDGKCYQHFTQGPCNEKGMLFLPDAKCDCKSYLPQYHELTNSCYEIGAIGPCGVGEVFSLMESTQRSRCQCKNGYIRYKNTTSCYRPFTQGPCQSNHILADSYNCVSQPCPKGYLYFPGNEQCYRIGTQGPCTRGRLVTFDFETRPSIDGISYNGVCSCDRYSCASSNPNQIQCNYTNGMAAFHNHCYKLYTQGPCPNGAWLVSKRQEKDGKNNNNTTTNNNNNWSGGKNKRHGICECMPGYIKTFRQLHNFTVIDCMSPTVILADYLNKNFSVS